MIRSQFLHEYALNGVINTGVTTNIYRATKHEGNVTVVIKVLKDDYPALEAIARLKHEYVIAANLDHENIVKILQLENQDNFHAIVFEDFGGISLKQYLENERASLRLTLQVAIAITKALIYIHSQNIIHKDIKPDNIIIENKQDNNTSDFHPVIKLTDFSIASCLSTENIQQANLNKLEGTLAYISPEQTGRMNRNLDYRSDFYSLGITLYEMLTGQVPFISDDPLELVHAHIAQQPIPIQKINPDINNTVCAIIEKLMAKNAEDRYQSGKGLLADLEKCWEQLEVSGTIMDFVPGELEVVSQLFIPQKLYGRESQIQLLLNAFEKTLYGNSELILVSGYSGIGKTALINEVHKPISRTKGHFISGKFDQFKRDIPYSALMQALSGLCEQLLTESSAQLELWRQKIQEAVGNSGQVIIDLIPEVELIIGKQPEALQLEATESQNRFNLVFQKFIKVFAQPEHPLVIFLDDLQWSDTATLKLIQTLIVDSQIQFLLIIGAYRNNEVNSVHPLVTTIGEIEKTHTVHNIILEPLAQHHVLDLVTDTLHGQASDCESLANLIFEKTAGNPFFLVQLLQVLNQEFLLRFDFNQQKWSWDIKEITTFGVTDKTVVELMVSRIEKLPKSTQEVLQLAACIGNKFNLYVLSMVTEASISETASRLNLALQAGLILPLSENYRIPLLFGERERTNSFDSKQISYKFLHDRVQQAAYSLIPEKHKQATHLRIGQLLKTLISQEDLESNILVIVNQLNLAVQLLNTDKEKYELASLNLIAGRKAKKNAAFAVALRYFHVALSLLSINDWQDNYEFTLGLHVETTEAEYLCGNFDKSQELASISLYKCQNILDQVEFYEIQIQSYTAKGEIKKALEIGVIALKKLGLKLPKQATKNHVLFAFAQTKLVLSGKKIEDLLYLPEMQDPYKLATMKMLMLITPVASLLGSLLLPVMTLAMVRLSVKYGNSIYSTYAYSGYGAVLCDKFGDINLGYRFAQLGIQLISKLNAYSLKAKVYMLYNAMVKHFKDHISQTLPELTEGMQSGIETGDLLFSSYNAYWLVLNIFVCNTNLDIFMKEIDKYLEFVSNNFKLESDIVWLKVLKQTVLILQKLSLNQIYSTGNYLNTNDLLSLYKDDASIMRIVCFCNTQTSYIFGDYKAAIIAAQESEKYSDLGFFVYLVNNFYYSLSLLADIGNISKQDKKKYLHQVKINQKKMKLWAYYAPCNFQHKYDLVEAEMARVLDKNNLANDLYDRAIAGAKANNFIAEEALANELAAKFYIEQGRDKFAKVYMTDAYYSYAKWEAFAKVKDLEDNYPDYIIRGQDAKSSETKTTAASTSYSQTLPLDTSTLIKSSLILSSEVVLEELIAKLMHLVKVNGGAEKVFFIAIHEDELVIEASLNEQNDIAVLQPLTIDIKNNSQNLLPISLVNYVKRTQKPIVLDDANNANNFKNDSYIIANQPKSILVSPIIHNGKMSGILYLENNLTNGAFTKDRLEILKVLSAQAAVSLENARFYSTLESRVQERTQQLQEKNQELKAITKQLQTTLKELKRTQSQLVHNEKMSSLGQLVAGIAHEINNPINFIYGNLAHTASYVESLLELIDTYQENCGDNPEISDMIEEIDLSYIREDVPKLLNSMRTGAARVRDIVKSLRIFSRLDEAKIKQVDIHESIDSTLMILIQRLGNIQVIKEYGQLPEVNCYAGELNQVFLNLITNAIDAISAKTKRETTSISDIKSENENIPTIRITTEVANDNRVIIRIADNGVGISDEIKHKIFDPFFTTKDVGQGTGMGLSICYQIITEKHKGSLEFMSSPKEGTTFIINIPSTVSA
ncbi:serine/threonine protein kinase with two-component sensor domain (plasmid) [Calothrix sp. NIES-4101]|nr:serine/threonine protein kinase with two-component sensor domain [Calothrix sp. NIES-4101]